ncbi:MAG: lipopolysaccharide biosynthesis protein [Clostridia bacterium]|nr:lipopolysaccharide biosynthesis protein [Clostridia bacterium]
MESKKNSAGVMVNFAWRFAERCGAQGVSFAVSIILARLLAPEAYGTIALITVFTSILNVFIDSGLGNALIQKKDADDTDFSTVFFFNIGVCILLYILMFFAAPWIAAFYEDVSLIPLIRVLSLTLVISGVKNVQQAYISRQLIFKRFFYATIGGTVVSAIIGIWMAYAGYGVWALVAQQLVNAGIGTVILWFTVKWRPKLLFSFGRLKGLFSFGWKLLCSALLETVYNDARQLIIGKLYSSSDLAFYNKGKQFPNLLINNVNASIDSVLLPVMSKEQDKKDNVRAITRRAMKTSTYIMAPMMMGLAFTSNTVVKLLLTEKWLPCVPYLCVFCITSMFYPIHTANLNAIKAMGRSDLFLRLEVIKKIVGILLLLSSMNFGVMAMAYSLLVSSVISQILNAWPNRKLLQYNYLEQLKDIMPNILLSVIMGVCVWLISLLPINGILLLLIQVLTGAVFYIGVSYLLKLESFMYFLHIIMDKFKKK